MTAQELRLGNWVKWVSSGNESMELDMMLDMGNLVAFYNGRIMLQPIPLTPEILNKCDFYGIIFPTQLSISNNGNYYWGNGINIEVKSLHQLQNLYFSLTNEELEIKF